MINEYRYELGYYQGSGWVSDWEDETFTLTVKYGGGDIFKFKDLPTSPDGLEKGQVYVYGTELHIIP